MAREINKSDFFDIFCKQQREITIWSCNRSYWITSSRDIIYLPCNSFEGFHFSNIFLVVNCPLVTGSYHFIEAELLFKRREPKKEWKVAKFQKQPFVDVLFNPFDATGLFLYPLKISKNIWFSDVFRGYRKRPGACNGLIGALKNFAKLTEICKCRILFFNKVPGLRPSTLLKRRLI